MEASKFVEMNHSQWEVRDLGENWRSPRSGGVSQAPEQDHVLGGHWLNLVWACNGEECPTPIRGGVSW